MSTMVEVILFENNSIPNLLLDGTILNINSENIQNGLNLSPSLRYTVLGVLILLLIVGSVGNVLTLLALPYVRRRYGTQFSILQTSTAILLFHLSFCDLLYILVGFTHFIHVLIEGRRISLWI